MNDDNLRRVDYPCQGNRNCVVYEDGRCAFNKVAWPGNPNSDINAPTEVIPLISQESKSFDSKQPDVRACIHPERYSIGFMEVAERIEHFMALEPLDRTLVRLH